MSSSHKNDGKHKKEKLKGAKMGLKVKLGFKKNLLIPVVSVFIVLIFLSAKHSPDYRYHQVTNCFTKVNSDHHLESRNSKGNENTLKLKKEPHSALIESVFVNRLLQSGLDIFNKWAERAKITAHVFVGIDSVSYEKYFDRVIKNVNDALLRLKRKPIIKTRR